MIREYVRAGLGVVHTAVPAVIVAYEPATQRASVQLVIHPRVDDPLLDVERPTATLPLPIANLPVLWPSGGGAPGTPLRWGITGMLVPGDPVTLLVIERSTDEWRTTGAPVNVAQDARRFDLSDAVVIPGGRSFNPAAPGFLAPLVVPTEVDPTKALVLYGGLGGIVIGSPATAVDFALKGTTFEADLLVWLNALGVLLGVMSTVQAPVTYIAALAAAAVTFNTANNALIATVSSGVHQSLKTRIE